MTEEKKINLSAVMPDPRHPISASEILALAAMGRDGQEAASRAVAARTVILGGKPVDGGITYGDLEIDGQDGQQFNFEG